MRLTCPLCGARDRREFHYYGAALDRPDGAAWDGAWHAYLHLRENPAGWRRERWFHEAGCGAWIEVERHTTTHAIRAAWLSAEGGVPEGREAAPRRAPPSLRDGGESASGGRSPGGHDDGPDGGLGSRGGADPSRVAPAGSAGGHADGGHADGGHADGGHADGGRADGGGDAGAGSAGAQ